MLVTGKRMKFCDAPTALKACLYVTAEKLLKMRSVFHRLSFVSCYFKFLTQTGILNILPYVSADLVQDYLNGTFFVVVFT